MDALLAALGRGQDGVFTPDQAMRYGGLSRAQVDRRVKAGEWVEVQPDVLRAATTPVTFRVQARSALLSIGGLVALCGHAGGYAADFPRVDEPRRIELAVDSSRADVGLRGVDIRRRRGFAPEHVVEHNGLAVLERHLLVLDLARSLSRRALHALVHDELFRDRVDPVRLNAARGRGRAGSALLGVVLSDIAKKHDTLAEVVGCALLREAGVHDLEPNESPYPHLTPADALIRAARLAIDINGPVHALTAKRRVDAAKAVDYAAVDYLLLPATNEDIFQGGITWARRVYALVEQRRAQFAGLTG